MNQPPQWAWTALACVYVIGAVLSFGHASNNCAMVYGERNDGSKYQHEPAYGIKVMTATVLWPLYVAHLMFRPAAVAMEAP
jgi:hypothetical protein